MKKIFSLFIGVSLALVSLHAELLLNEHFDRALGTLSSSTWSSGNIPNDSNWHTYSPGSVQFQVVEQQLSRTDYSFSSAMARSTMPSVASSNNIGIWISHYTEVKK